MRSHMRLLVACVGVLVLGASVTVGTSDTAVAQITIDVDPTAPVDGCGGATGRYLDAVAQSSCEERDQCYGTLEVTQRQCDTQFRENGLRWCGVVYPDNPISVPAEDGIEKWNVNQGLCELNVMLNRPKKKEFEEKQRQAEERRKQREDTKPLTCGGLLNDIMTSSDTVNRAPQSIAVNGLTFEQTRARCGFNYHLGSGDYGNAIFALGIEFDFEDHLRWLENLDADEAARYRNSPPTVAAIMRQSDRYENCDRIEPFLKGVLERFDEDEGRWVIYDQSEPYSDGHSCDVEDTYELGGLKLRLARSLGSQWCVADAWISLDTGERFRRESVPLSPGEWIIEGPADELLCNSAPDYLINERRPYRSVDLVMRQFAELETYSESVLTSVMLPAILFDVNAARGAGEADGE